MRIISFLLDLVYPPKCPFCGRIMSAANAICPCTDSLVKPENTALQNANGSVERFIAPFSYEGPVKDSLHSYKFSGVYSYSASYGACMKKTVDAAGVSCDIITWVPLGKKRRRKRGYDQAELLAKALSAELGIPAERLLCKRVDNPAQAKAVSAAARARNVAQVYSPAEPFTGEGKRVLLVDDIITTGATVSSCARVLKEAGVSSVIAVAVAKTPLCKK